MSITGYATRFGLLRLVTVFAEQAYNVAGFLLNSGKPLQTSAAPVASFPPRSEDAAEGPPPIAPDSVSGGGHPNVGDIVDEYWDTAR